MDATNGETTADQPIATRARGLNDAVTRSCLVLYDNSSSVTLQQSSSSSTIGNARQTRRRDVDSCARRVRDNRHRECGGDKSCSTSLRATSTSTAAAAVSSMRVAFIDERRQRATTASRMSSDADRAACWTTTTQHVSRQPLQAT